jgi:hypothetical protein
LSAGSTNRRRRGDPPLQLLVYACASRRNVTIGEACASELVRDDPRVGPAL